jgi:ribosomal protein S18 acetylase RimI-like enzyme
MLAATVVRDAVPAEFDAVRRIATRANDEFRAPMGDRLYQGYLANVLDVERRAAEAAVLVAEREGELLGTITVYRDVNAEGMPARLPDGTAGIRATAVDPSARGRGIGAELVAAALSRAAGWGAPAIALHTAPCMEAAIRLYERFGFRREPGYDYRANDFFADGSGEPLEAIAFVLDLRARG